MKEKLPLKQQLDALDYKKRKWYDSLSDEDKKQVSPWVLMRFLSSSGGSREFQEYFLEMTNDVVNVHFNTVRHHPDLQVGLMQAVGLKQSIGHPWIAPGKRGQQSKLHTIVSELHPNLNDDEVDLFVREQSKDDMIDMLDQLGYEKKEIKKLLK